MVCVMETLNLEEIPLETAARRTAAALAAGAVAAAPTETVYGLMACWGNKAGRERIYRMKGRDQSKPLQMLAPGLESARRAGVWLPAAARALAAAFWPGPLTLVLPARAGDGEIGLRLPDHPFIRAVLEFLEEPLAATSANRSGAPPALDGASAVRGLHSPPDLLVDGGRVAGGRASTVVRCTADGRLELLRPGPISMERLETALRS